MLRDRIPRSSAYNDFRCMLGSDFISNLWLMSGGSTVGRNLNIAGWSCIYAAHALC